MDVKCPHCQIEFNSDDIEHTAIDGYFHCPVCKKKFPSPLATQEGKERKRRVGKYLLPVIFIFAVLAAFYLINSPTKVSPPPPQQQVPARAPQSNDAPGYNPPPSAPAAASAPEAVNSPSPVPDRLRMIEKIAADFRKTHTYTLEGDFVCLDMAINVWNQLITHGIPAKIMVGNVNEDMTSTYRLLVTRSNHAWVVAGISPNDKVAVETTSGAVIKPGMANSCLYFKGIEFTSPAQVKEFESLRKRAAICREAHDLVVDWNNNVAGKKRVTAEMIEKKSRMEQRIQDCETVMSGLDKFKSQAVYY